MAKVGVHFTDYVAETVAALTSGGLLLASAGKDGQANLMTIGWGTIGVIWGKPIFVVLVRPSRHTFRLLNQTDEFTVNVPYPNDELLVEACRVCGSQSGRDLDKFAECELAATPGREVRVPIVQQCGIHYECQVVHKNNVAPVELEPGIMGEYYPSEDFHTVYYGEIVACYADENAKDRL